MFQRATQWSSGSVRGGTVRRLSIAAAASLLAAPAALAQQDASGAVVGAVGISGDVSDNDEAAAVAGIEAAGLGADPGKD